MALLWNLRQGRSSHILIGPAKSLLSLPLLPSLPLPPFHPLPPFTPLPLEVGPLLRLEGLGERLSSPSGSGGSPAAKRILVHFELKNQGIWWQQF